MTLQKLFSHKKHGLAVLMALVAGGLFSLTGCTPPAGTISEELRITETWMEAYNAIRPHESL